MLFEEHIDPWFKAVSDSIWGSQEWRSHSLFAEDVNTLYATNLTLMKSLHKKYITRLDRVATYAKVNEFLYEDGLKMFLEANNDVSDYLISMVF